MSDYIQHIKKIDAQIVVLDKIIKSETYVGAGITVGLSVGKVEEDEDFALAMEFGTASMDLQPELLILFRRGLMQSRAFWEAQARAEMKALSDFLGGPV